MKTRNTTCAAGERNESLDLLRVLCMFLIVLGHSIVHGQVTEHVPIFSVNYFLTYILYALLIVHVNCFVLLSGYFQCEKEASLSKVISLWGHIFFWSVACYLVFVVIGQEPFSIKSIIKAALPFTQQRYWFATTYLLMYALCPFINKLIRAMDQRQHAGCLAVFFLVFILLQNLVFWREFTAVNGSSPLFFVFLYMTAAYVRRYPPQKKHPWFLGYLLLCAVGAGSRFLLTWITTPIFGVPMGETICSGYSSVVVYLGSVALFMTFVSMRLRTGWLAKLSVFLSPLTFGIYLIHDNPETRTFIWKTVLKPYQFLDSPMLIPYAFGCAILVFAVSGMVEYVRMRVSRTFGMRRLVECASVYMEKVYEKCLKIVFSV